MRIYVDWNVKPDENERLGNLTSYIPAQYYGVFDNNTIFFS